MPLFTRENAAAMARRANLVRWSRPDPPEIPPQLPDNGAKEIASHTREQIAAIDRRMAKVESMSPETLDLLTRSKERLWKILAHAGGIPQPAHFKPSRKDRAGSQAIDLEPVAFAVLPEPPQMTDSTAPAPTVAASAPETTPSQPAGQDPEPITLSTDEAARLLSP